MSQVESVLYKCACGRKLNAPGYAQGKQARCPACKTVSIVPFAIAEIKALNKLMDLSDQLPDEPAADDSDCPPIAMRPCHHCNASVPTDAEFCPGCGLPGRISVMLTERMASRFDRNRNKRKRDLSGDSGVMRALKSLFRAEV